MRICAHWPILAWAAAGWVFTSSPALAGAWPLYRGDTLLILSLGHNQLLDSKTGLDLRRAELAAYFEYGLHDRVTLVGRASLQSIPGGGPVVKTKKGQIRKSALTGFQNLELGARGLVWRSERWAVSAQLSAVWQTSPAQLASQPLAFDQTDLDGRVLIGRSIGDRGFIEVQAGWRERLDQAGSESRVDVTAGARLFGEVHAMVQTYSVWSTRRTRIFETYSGHRVQASIQWPLNRGGEIQLSVLSTIAAERMAEERAVMASIWRAF